MSDSSPGWTPGPGYPGKKIVPLIFIGFVIFSLIGLFGTWAIGKHFEPMAKQAYENSRHAK